MTLETNILCDNKEYGNGYVTFISEDEKMCTIKFINKDLPIMCSTSTNKTLHLEGSKNVKFNVVLTTLEQLEKLGIEPKWYVIEDFCATLIVKDGNPDNVEDRIAFIEKTPRIKINDEWISGPKGEGGSIEEDGKTIYGFYTPSRKWCEEELLKELGEK